MAAGLFQRPSNEIDLKAAHLIVEVNAAAKILHCAHTGTFFRSAANGLWIADLRPETFTRNFVARSNDDRSLYCVFEFANVAWPRVTLKQRQHLRRDLLRHLAAILFVIFLDEVLRQRQDVFAPVP